MLNKIIELSKRLIFIPSTKDNPKEITKVLETALSELKGFTIERFESNGFPSALIYSGTTRPKKFKIILNGHLDVVPGRPEQFNPKEINGKLYGRGSDDMKAATAVLILLFKELVNKVKYPLGLQLVTDEEIGGINGVKYQISQGVITDFFIAGETTKLKIKNEAKGVLWINITIKGTKAHGAYLWKGKNALWELKTILDRIEKAYPVPKYEVWETTVNLARISTTNVTPNQVPDNAVASLDVRYVPADAKTIINKIEKIIGKKAKMEYLENEPVHYTAENNYFIRKLQQICKQTLNKEIPIIKEHGASDARHYSRVGIAGIVFGPIGEGLHSDNEWVDIKSLADYYTILKKFLLSL